MMLLITGASGRIGRRVAELVADKGHALRLMTRNPQHAPNIPTAEIVEGDFDDFLSMHTAFAGVTTALIVSGSGKPGDRARLHRSAFESPSRAGVGHIIYLSLQGSAPESRYPYSRDHYASEHYLTLPLRGFPVPYCETRFTWTCFWNNLMFAALCADRPTMRERRLSPVKTWRELRRRCWWTHLAEFMT
jgi:nucleoside-diphosphate-sugar epimerase